MVDTASLQLQRSAVYPKTMGTVRGYGADTGPCIGLITERLPLGGIQTHAEGSHIKELRLYLIEEGVLYRHGNPGHRLLMRLDQQYRIPYTAIRCILSCAVRGFLRRKLRLYPNLMILVRVVAHRHFRQYHGLLCEIAPGVRLFQTLCPGKNPIGGDVQRMRVGNTHMA